MIAEMNNAANAMIVNQANVVWRLNIVETAVIATVIGTTTSQPCRSLALTNLPTQLYSRAQA